MTSQLVTVTFNTSRLDRMVAFYNALGAQLEESRVNKGGQIFRGILGNLEVVLHSIAKPGEAPAPRVSLRFELQSIEAVWGKVKSLPQADIIMDLESMPSGKSFIVIDPDGHSIEIFERWKDQGDSAG